MTYTGHLIFLNIYESVKGKKGKFVVAPDITVTVCGVESSIISVDYYCYYYYCRCKLKRAEYAEKAIKNHRSKRILICFWSTVGLVVKVEAVNLFQLSERRG